MIRRYAHSSENRPIDEWEPLEDHLRLVAEGDGRFLLGAAQFAAAFGAEQWGRVLGFWHDLGKFSDRFQERLRRLGGVDDGHESSVCLVDHSTAGAQHAARCGGELGRLLAYCIAGHHSGLPDDIDEQGGSSGLSQRLKKPMDPYTAAPRELLEIPPPPAPELQSAGNQGRNAFAVAFFTRMVFSCLVDADYLATEWFMDPERAGCRRALGATLAELSARLTAFLEGKRPPHVPDTPVNRRRREVLEACREKAALAPGFFSLNVPTGGGKTLSSLAFALAHAIKHGLRRVVYAIPFTSIIEQTADVFREALGDLKEEVLEYHSHLDLDDPNKQSERSRLAAENFDAPLIVTTNVQLFESLFASRPSRCRKLHRLARSVVILDEAQTLPSNLLAPTLAALDELVRHYGSTVVLCTATQPAIEKRDTFPIGLEHVRPIIEEPQALHLSMKRTCVEQAGMLSDEELAERLRHERQVLCVVNSRRHAAALFHLLGDHNALHLSANMCATHRARVIQRIRRRLSSEVDKPCRVISTQVIEAGVDVDFPTVYRAVAGLDSIAQAAGRCNREGQLRGDDGRPRRGRLVVFEYDEKKHRPPPFIRRAAGHFREVVPDHTADLLAPQAVEAYFRVHYWLQGGEGGRGWDRGRGGRSVMKCFGGEDGNVLHHQFREAANRYQIIDDALRPIVVPYDKRGRALIRELEQMPDLPEPRRLRAFDRTAQRYVVNVHEKTLRELLERGLVLERHGRYYLANCKAYDRNVGLTCAAVGLDPERTVL